MDKLYIIQGFLGAGKSTFSQKLALETNSILYNPDNYVMQFFKEEEFLNNWNECFQKTVDKLWIMAEKELKSGNNVIFDMGFWDKESRDYAREFAKKNKVQLVHYYVYAPDEVLLERIKSRKGKIAESNYKNFYQIKENFIEPDKDENAIVINNY